MNQPDAHFTPLDRSFTYRMHWIAKLSDRTSARAYQDEFGLALGEARCLAAVGQFGPLSVKDLARRANLDKANASRAADALIAQGLMSKALSERDARGVTLRLTRAGRSRWRELMRLIERRNSEIFGCLSPAERQAFGLALDRIAAHLADGGQGR